MVKDGRIAKTSFNIELTRVQIPAIYPGATKPFNAVDT